MYLYDSETAGGGEAMTRLVGSRSPEFRARGITVRVRREDEGRRTKEGRKSENFGDKRKDMIVCCVIFVLCQRRSLIPRPICRCLQNTECRCALHVAPSRTAGIGDGDGDGDGEIFDTEMPSTVCKESEYLPCSVMIQCDKI